MLQNQFFSHENDFFSQALKFLVSNCIVIMCCTILNIRGLLDESW